MYTDLALALHECREQQSFILRISVRAGIASILLLGSAATPSLAEDKHPTVDLCEIVKSCSGWHAITVQVKGEWISGIHGETLSVEKCKDFEISDTTGFPVLEVRTSDSVPDGEANITFSTNKESVTRVRALSREKRTQVSKIDVIATGELRCAQNYSVRVNENGMLVGNGYGFVGRYPALLIIQDIEVVKPQSPK